MWSFGRTFFFTALALSWAPVFGCSRSRATPPATNEAGVALTASSSSVAAVASSSPPPPATFNGSSPDLPEEEDLTQIDAGGCILVGGFQNGPEIEIVGRLTVDEHYQHPNGTLPRPYILKLERPHCAIGVEEKTVKEVHVYPEGRIDFRLFKSAKIRVKGKPFAWHTAWHARPIVLPATSVTRVGPAPVTPPLEPLPDGKHFGFVDKIDLGARTLSFDPAMLYRGKAAIAEAKRRHALEAVLNDGKTVDPNETFVTNDEPDYRTIALAEGVVLEAVTNEKDGGHQPLAVVPVAKLAEVDAGSGKALVDRAYEITLKDGRVTKIQEVERYLW